MNVRAWLAAAMTVGVMMGVPQTNAATAPAQGEPRDCFNTRAITGYGIIDDHNVSVHVNAHRRYIFSTAWNARNLDWTFNIAIHSAMTSPTDTSAPSDSDTMAPAGSAYTAGMSVFAKVTSLPLPLTSRTTGHRSLPPDAVAAPAPPASASFSRSACCARSGPASPVCDLRAGRCVRRWLADPACASAQGIGASEPLPAAAAVKPSIPRHVAMSQARRLMRVLGIEIEGSRSSRALRSRGLLRRSSTSRVAVRRGGRDWHPAHRPGIARGQCRGDVRRNCYSRIEPAPSMSKRLDET